jgi:hypothetical protein
MRVSFKRKQQALRMRNLGLAVVRARGVLTGKGTGMQTLDATAGSLNLTLRTPFGWSRKDIASENAKYRLAVAGSLHRGNLPYGLDIWSPTRKVTNIEWDDKGAVEILGYYPGSWEDELAKLASEIIQD